MRTPSADPPVKVTTNVTQELYGRIKLHLFSEMEQGVPAGSVSRFVKERCAEFFDSEALDLAPYITDVTPGTLSVRGTSSAIEALRRKLEEV